VNDQVGQGSTELVSHLAENDVLCARFASNGHHDPPGNGSQCDLERSSSPRRPPTFRCKRSTCG
jgi:hypothetical protein